MCLMEMLIRFCREGFSFLPKVLPQNLSVSSTVQRSKENTYCERQMLGCGAKFIHPAVFLLDRYE